MTARRTSLLAVVAVAGALTLGYLAQGTYAAGTPANKVAASGSELEVMGPGEDIVLLSETVKINNPTDLILSATAECSIVTEVKTTGNATGKAEGKITMWVTIDGKPVPVSSADAGNGRVVYCNRIHEQETKLDGDEDDENDDFVRTYLETRDANGFNWMALNVGTNYGTSNIHQVQLHAKFEVNTSATATATAFAKAVVGNRTLILEPVKAANGETVSVG